jgi:hypothetical protein
MRECAAELREMAHERSELLLKGEKLLAKIEEEDLSLHSKSIPITHRKRYHDVITGSSTRERADLRAATRPRLTGL